MAKLVKVILGIGMTFGIIILVGLLIGFPAKIIINYLFTQHVLLLLFGIPQMTFWKAFWLTVLCGMLFKGSSSSSSK